MSASHRGRRKRLVAATFIAAAGIAAVLVLSAAGPAGAYTPAPCGTGTAIIPCPPPPDPNLGYPAGQPSYTYNTCLWGYVLSQHTWQTNQTGADSNNQYYTANFTLQPGSKLVLHGQFPHTRSYSFTTYGTVNGQPGTNTGGVTDVDINPDPGSQNPFRPGVRRNIKNRSFTLTVDSAVKPANPAPNTFYVGRAGEENTAQRVNLSIRHILPDKLYEPISPLPGGAMSNIMGGVAPPVPTYVPATGNSVSGQAACDAIDSNPGFPNAPNIYDTGLPDDQYAMLRDLGPVGHPAQAPVEWQRFYNFTQFIKPLLENTPYAPLIDQIYTERDLPGFFGNPYTKYIFAYIDRRLGPAPDGHNVLVLHFRIPTTPTTYNGDPEPNNNDSVQARLTSLCTYTSPAVATNIQSFTRCLNDESMLPDRNRWVTLVLSTAGDRPKNATAKCGVGWHELEPWGDNFGIINKTDQLINGAGPGGEIAGGVLPGPPPTSVEPGGTDPFLYVAVIRQTLASPSFDKSYASVPSNSQIKQYLGDYYPGGTYMSADQFDQTHPCAPGHQAR